MVIDQERFKDKEKSQRKKINALLMKRSKTVGTATETEKPPGDKLNNYPNVYFTRGKR
jgi:hypothetical protein